MDDTAPAITARMSELYRRMTPSQKVERVMQLTHLSEQLALTQIEKQHPTESAREWRLRLVSRHLPAELMKKAFGWDPALKGY